MLRISQNIDNYQFPHNYWSIYSDDHAIWHIFCISSNAWSPCASSLGNKDIQIQGYTLGINPIFNLTNRFKVGLFSLNPGLDRLEINKKAKLHRHTHKGKIKNTKYSSKPLYKFISWSMGIHRKLPLNISTKISKRNHFGEAVELDEFFYIRFTSNLWISLSSHFFWMSIRLWASACRLTLLSSKCLVMR